MPPHRHSSALCASNRTALILATSVLAVINSSFAIQFTPVPDLTATHVAKATVAFAGTLHASFRRPLPHTVDPNLLVDFEASFNSTQVFSAQGNNVYDADGQQFVLRVSDGHVTGVLGLVTDSDGRAVLAASTSPASSAPLHRSTQECKRFKKLATSIQKYGQLYYHFLLEVLPRVLLLKPLLDDDTKLLMFGAPYEAAWLVALGVDPARVEVYDPSLTYCADELLVPTQTAVITPAKEAIVLVRHAFVAPSSSQMVQPAVDTRPRPIVYCSRRGDEERVVANEPALLAALRAAFPDTPVVVFTGAESVADTVSLFRRARAVVGMHGAGLSHLLFAEPGTPVVEFLFLRDPPLMFWHAAAALGLPYWMVPLAQSYWLAPSVTVPEQDVVDALQAALLGSGGGGGLDATDACAAGFQASDTGGGACTQCQAGTYSPASSRLCLPCGEGRYSVAGAAACRTCPEGSFAVAATSCKACPAGSTTMFPGASSADQCQPAAAAAVAMQALFSRDVLASKLVQIPGLDARLARLLQAPKGRTGRRLRATPLSREVHAPQLAFLDDLLSDDAAGRHSVGAHQGGRRLAYVTPVPLEGGGCPVGQQLTTPAFGGAADAVCSAICPAGTFAQQQSGMATFLCAPCADGSFSTAGAVGACTQCIEGRASDSDHTGCSVCALGWALGQPKFTPAGGGDLICQLDCPAGAFLAVNPDPSLEDQCTLCPVGTISLGGTVKSCDACPQGQGPNAAASACVAPGCPGNPDICTIITVFPSQFVGMSKATRNVPVAASDITDLAVCSGNTCSTAAVQFDLIGWMSPIATWHSTGHAACWDSGEFDSTCGDWADATCEVSFDADFALDPTGNVKQAMFAMLTAALDPANTRAAGQFNWCTWWAIGGCQLNPGVTDGQNGGPHTLPGSVVIQRYRNVPLADGSPSHVDAGHLTLTIDKCGFTKADSCAMPTLIAAAWSAGVPGIGDLLAGILGTVAVTVCA